MLYFTVALSHMYPALIVVVIAKYFALIDVEIQLPSFIKKKTYNTMQPLRTRDLAR
jgi:hypothetical protein